MKNKKKVVVDENLKQEVLDMIDTFYSVFNMDRKSKTISLEIVKSISFEYCNQNCELHFIFEERVIPYLKKLDENTRLEMVKGLLTDGYIDIDDHRINMMYMPYLNYDENNRPTEFITIIK